MYLGSDKRLDMNKDNQIKKQLVIRGLKQYSRHFVRNIYRFVKWMIISVVTGLVVGAYSSLFAESLLFVTDLRGEYPWILYTLPLGGCFIVLLYKIFNYSNNKGTNLVLSTIHAQDDVEFKMAPLIFIATVITHMCGGSAGREGAALQMGGSIGNQMGRWLRLDDNDRRVVVMCGMSAAFSALFGTPMAAAIFAMEVVSVGVMYYAALVPCVFASLVATTFATNLGIRPENFHILEVPDMNLLNALGMILLSAVCAGLSVLFCMMLHKTGDMYRKYIRNPYIRIVFAGCLIIVLTMIFGRDYLGAGIEVIEKAVTHGEVFAGAFILKMIFTAITIEAGFKGGEIVPSFFVGATFGCLFGQIIGLSPSLCAAAGMIAVFCGVTNCPITSILISFELFGFEGVPYFLIASSVGYLMSGYYGLYHDQTIVYSKYKTEYVNRKTRK